MIAKDKLIINKSLLDQASFIFNIGPKASFFHTKRYSFHNT